jgi:fatty acid amide hydrolase
MEDKIIKDYLLDASKLMIKNCNKKTAMSLTSKYINNLINYPELQNSDPIIKGKNIRDFTAMEIQKLIVSKEITMQEIVNAYHKQKQIIGNSHYSLTWSMYEEPIQKAKEIDREIQNISDPTEFEKKYPLAGFVVSVKDNFYLKNTPNTSGMFINLDRVATKDPKMFAYLKEKGAVLTCKGNIPQFLISIESNNNLYGNTQNTFDRTRTGGGSTGGDSVNVSLGFANIAIGSDVGGSLRIPALHLGLYSLKTSNYRVTTSAMGYMFDRKFGSEKFECEVQNEGRVQMLLKINIGPIAKCVDDIDRFMNVLCSDQKYDNLVSPIPWNLNPKFKKRIGVFRKLEIMEPSKASSRAIDIAIERLKREGYEFVEVDLNDLFEECIKFSLICFNMSPFVMKIFTGEIPIREKLSKLHLKSAIIAKTPDFLLRWITYLKKKSRVGSLLDYFMAANRYTQDEVYSACARLYKQLEQTMTNLEIDAILLPGFPTPAPKLFDSNVIFTCYLIIFNFLRMPAGICPITKVREDEQFYESQHKDLFTKKLDKTMRNSKGLPIGVQIACRSHHDEVVVNIMKDLEKHFED